MSSFKTSDSTCVILSSAANAAAPDRWLAQAPQPQLAPPGKPASWEDDDEEDDDDFVDDEEELDLGDEDDEDLFEDDDEEGLDDEEELLEDE